MREHRPTARWFGPLAALGLAVLALSVAATGCGEKDDELGGDSPQEFSLLLDFFPNADHAGIYAAEAEGEFEEVGLDVTIRPPTDPSAPIKQVAAGRVDAAISYEPEVLLARDRGQPVVAVGALVQRPLTSLISLPRADIRGAGDLDGKTVGTAGIPYQTALLRGILRDANVDPGSVEQKDVGFGLQPALLTRRVDATFGAFWNYEGTELRLKRRPARILRADQLGVPTYNELVFVVNERTLEEEPGKIRALLGAVARGTRELRRNPREGIEALLEANKDLDPRLQRAVVRETMPLFFPPAGRPFGYQDPAQWSRFATWMRENELLEEPPEPERAATNELLPGSGP